jgi:hypothetical protein
MHFLQSSQHFTLVRCTQGVDGEVVLSIAQQLRQIFLQMFYLFFNVRLHLGLIQLKSIIFMLFMLGYHGRIISFLSGQTVEHPFNQQPHFNRLCLCVLKDLSEGTIPFVPPQQMVESLYIQRDDILIKHVSFPVGGIKRHADLLIENTFVMLLRELSTFGWKLN